LYEKEYQGKGVWQTSKTLFIGFSSEGKDVFGTQYQTYEIGR
jgi:hypothetical protein